MNLNKIAGATASVKVGFAGETATITYDPSVLTQKALTESQKNDTSFLQFLTTVIKTWDVVKGAGKGQRKIPLTVAGLSEVPLPFLRAIFQTIMQDGAGESEGEAESNSSAG